MNLQENLSKIRREFECGDTPREVIDVLSNHIEDLLKSNATDNAIPAGGNAPLDSLIPSKTEILPLSFFSGKQYLVLTWFRGNW